MSKVVKISDFSKPPVFKSVAKKQYDIAWKDLPKSKQRKLLRKSRARKVRNETAFHEAKRRTSVPRERWLEIHKEHIRWKKTESYERWRRKQFLRQGGTCWYCDEPLWGVRVNDEHVIPKILGGDNRRSNLVLACSSCNRKKYSTLLSYEKRKALKEKNRLKRGTYLLNRQRYKTESDVALELHDMFRED